MPGAASSAARVLGRSRSRRRGSAGRGRRESSWPRCARGRRGVLPAWRPGRCRWPRPARRRRRAARPAGSLVERLRPGATRIAAVRPASRSSRRLAEAVDRREPRLAAARELPGEQSARPRRRGAAAPSARRSRSGIRRRRPCAAETSPVNAPAASAATFWHASDQRPARSRAASSAVNGGATTSSPPGDAVADPRAELRARTPRASARVLCIFQLATKSFMCGSRQVEEIGFRLPSFQRLDSRQLPLGQKLERRAPARRDVRELLGDAGLVRGRDALAAADDRDGRRDRRASVASAIVPWSNGRLLEDAHRAVPEDRPRRTEQPRELLERLLGRRRAPSRPRESCRSPTVFAPGAVVGRLRHDEIRRQRDRLARLLAEVEDLARERRPCPPRAATCRPSRPRARTKWFAIPPPTSRMSARRESTRSVSILPEIFAPPRIAANGRSGSSRRESSRTSFSSRRPAPFSATSLRHADDRGMRAVRRAEGVVDVDVGESRERLRRTPDRWPPRRRGSGGSRAAGPRRARGRRAARSASGPMQSSTNRTGRPSSSAKRTATGASESSGFGLPLGLPRCEAQRTRAPRSSASRTVGQRLDDARVVGDAAARRAER